MNDEWSALRPWGWGLVALLVAVALGWGFLAPAKGSAEPLPHELDQLAVAPAAKQSTLLSELSSRLARNGDWRQVMIVQATPKGPLVVGNVQEDDGDEEATHWPAPWPAVTTALATPPTTPQTASGEYRGVRYQHRIVPLDSAAGRYLLINSAAEPSRWFGPRAYLLLAAYALAVGLIFSVPAQKSPRRR